MTSTRVLSWIALSEWKDVLGATWVISSRFYGLGAWIIRTCPGFASPIALALSGENPMAIQFTYSITIAFEEDQLEQIRSEAAKRKSSVEGTLDDEFDLSDIKDCAAILLGDPLEAIAGDLQYQEASFGVVSAEAGVPFKYYVSDTASEVATAG